jgi:hypothetical protein
MRVKTLWVAFALANAAFAAGQEPADAPASVVRTLRLGLEPLYLPGYEPARELRLAAWDSPMSRLELAAAREQWAVVNPGPSGTVVPFQGVRLPLRLNLASPAESLVTLPWSPSWGRLTWQEKVAAGAQDGVLIWALVDLLGRLR